MRQQGKISKWRDDKGFGYIAPDSGGPEIFLHEDAFLRQSRRPVTGEKVTFEATSAFDGKSRANRVLYLGESDPRRIAVIGDILLGTLAFVFFATICGLTYSGSLPLEILMVYLSTSFCSVLMYRFDKSAAGSNQWRTKENSLHLLSLMGGWPGALMAQRLFRHKTKKRSFQKVYWGTVVINVGLLVLLVLPVGKSFLKTALPACSIKYKQIMSGKISNTNETKHKGTVYSWTTKEGKKVFSTVGFPEEQTYTDGKIEWR